MASFRAKSARGMRSGDGREGRLGLEKASSIPPGRSKGEGIQAMAWRTTSFEKLDSGAKDKDTSNCSSSTSPETDPGTSNVFPLFAGRRKNSLSPSLDSKHGGRSITRWSLDHGRRATVRVQTSCSRRLTHQPRAVPTGCFGCRSNSPPPRVSVAYK